MARTDNTLLLGDLETCKLSEVEWRSDGNEKFIFDNESVCIIYYNGELTIIMYGKNAVSMKFPRPGYAYEHMSIHLDLPDQP